MGSVSDPGGDVEYAERGREEGMSVEKNASDWSVGGSEGYRLDQ